MKHNSSHILVCFLLLFIVGPVCLVSAQGERIIFKESLGAVHDSIVVMNALLDKLVASEEKNYFFDKHGFLFINNRKMGKVQKDNRVDFLSLMAVQTELSERECKKFLALSMFLKRNFMSGCIRHVRHGAYFYIYQPAGTKESDDFRYIVSYDERLINLTGTEEAESFTVLDRQQNLLLLFPGGEKK
jgi:hypothetical protein